MAIRAGFTAHARTSDVPVSERFAYFRDAVEPVILGTRTEWGGTGDFEAEFDAVAAGTGSLARMQAPGCTGRRDERLVRRRPDDALYLNIGASPHRVEHLGRARSVPAWQPVLLDSERPFVVDFTADRRFRLFTLRVERGAGLAPDAEAVRRIGERIGSTPAGRQLTIQARLMCAELEAGRPAIAAAMSAPVRALLAVLAAEHPEPPRRFESVASIARGRLADAGFRLQDLADAVAVSSRTIQSVFRAEGTTFGRWLLEERLDLARTRLLDPAWGRHSVGAIARASGFWDTTHFHRAYRQRYGDTPGAARTAGDPDTRA